MNFEKEMYEVKEKWEESYFSDEDKERIQHVSSLIPQCTSGLQDLYIENGGMSCNSKVVRLSK